MTAGRNFDIRVNSGTGTSMSGDRNFDIRVNSGTGTSMSGGRILLIKLGALGDVLRTTSLLPGLRKKWPGAAITWLMADRAKPLVARNPDVDRIVTIEEGADFSGEFECVINLDEDERATSVAARSAAKCKFGIGRDSQGRLTPLNPESALLIRLASDDRLKFRENQIPFQALIYQAVGLTWLGEPYRYVPPEDQAERQAGLLSQIFRTRAGAKKIGVFTGASDRYANKFWSEAEIEEFCSEFRNRTRWGADWDFFLFGGVDETESIRRLTRIGVPGICVSTLDDLAAVVSACDRIVCGDTLVMHLAEAMSIRQAVLFGPTSHAEITVSGEKIVSPYSCGPCYLRKCGIRPSCMSAIRPGRVWAVLEEMGADQV